jgi:hypothetical protein
VAPRSSRATAALLESRQLVAVLYAGLFEPIGMTGSGYGDER